MPEQLRAVSRSIRGRVLSLASCFLLVISAQIISLSGCSRGAPFELIPVSGKVTYSDGSRIDAEQITVTFVPETLPPTGPKPSPAYGLVYPVDGSFVLTTGRPEDGATPGKNRVLVTAFKGRKQILPNQYTDPKTTPLTVDVVDGDPMVVHLKVERKL